MYYGKRKLDANFDEIKNVIFYICAGNLTMLPVVLVQMASANNNQCHMQWKSQHAQNTPTKSCHTKSAIVKEKHGWNHIPCHDTLYH